MAHRDPPKSERSGELALDVVYKFLMSVPKLESTVGNAIRQGIDEVIQGPRTGRWSIDELEKVEKTYIGTRVEILVRSALGLERGNELSGNPDYRIRGHFVDAKFSIFHWRWMIPREAMGQLCLLISAEDAASLFHVGLVRITEDILTASGNRDGKRSISAAGRTAIRWVVEEGKLPRNFLMHDINAKERAALFKMPAGQARVNELFLRFPHKPIPATTVVELATEFEDARRHAIEAAREVGCEILDGDDPNDVKAAAKLNITLPPGHFISTKS